MTLDRQSLFARAETFSRRTALVDAGADHSYRQLLEASARVAAVLLAGQGDLAEARVAYLLPSSFGHVAVQWGIWRAGGLAVPLCPEHPAPELEYVLRDSGASVVLCGAEHEEVLQSLAPPGARVLSSDVLSDAPADSLPSLAPERRAMMLYTSGTTSRPKGVVLTHANLRAQVTMLVDAWGWTEEDRILHVLPLHHVHGVVNVLTCALWSGAACELLPRFDPVQVWERLAAGGLTLFMAVPTIYARLIAAWERASSEERLRWSRGAGALRLMVSGSAALPVSVLERWREITGHTLLERYGMTEIGMALSNPLHGERRPGTVGMPLPGVEARLVAEDGAPVPPGTPGEIEIRGAAVFHEYWGRPEAAAEAFRDGWFRTGDVAVVEDGYYRILGRSSVDIIKTGGYKVSALEIEEVLRKHPELEAVAVVGVPDTEWGERVCAAVVPRAGVQVDPDGLRAWSRERLARYKAPSRFLVIPDLPRNAMGKVVKPEIKRLFTDPGS